MNNSLLSVLLPFALVACAPTPARTFDQMKRAACAGDIQGFFAHVDKTRTGEAAQKMALAEAQANTQGPEVGKAIGAALVGAAMPGMIQQGFVVWEDDIKKGEAGDLCKMTFVAEEPVTETSVLVRWKTGTGRDKTYTFERFGDKWMVVAMK